MQNRNEGKPSGGPEIKPQTEYYEIEKKDWFEVDNIFVVHWGHKNGYGDWDHYAAFMTMEDAIVWTKVLENRANNK